MRGRIHGLLAATLLFAATPAALAADKLAINTGFTPPVSNVLKAIVSEAAGRLGLEVDFRQLSAERSLKLVAMGIDDGDCCRIPAVVQKDYPDLLTVPEPVFTARFVAFTSKPDIRITSWDDLKPHVVGCVSGWKLLVQRINQLEPRGHWILDDPRQMFEMLNQGRIDVATLGLLSGQHMLRSLNMDSWVKPQIPPLAERQLYLQLHPRHRRLVPDLARVLREMREDGSIQRLTEQTLRELRQ